MKHVYLSSVRLAPFMLTKALIGFIALVCVSLVLEQWRPAGSTTDAGSIDDHQYRQR
ncbi:hypothetical protein SE337_16045 [Pseudomonas amygdali pv. sesami]